MKYSFKPKLHKVTWILLITFIGFAVADIFSTLQSGPFIKYLETNPLYPTIGLPGIFLLNILAAYILVISYNNGKPYVRYGIITMLVYHLVVRFAVIKNNFQVASEIKAGQITMEMAKSIPQEAKAQIYNIDVALALLIPLLLSWIIYGLFMMDHKVVER